MNKFVHCIWYCFQGCRFEDVEISVINEMRQVYNEGQIPIIIVHTQSLSQDESQKMMEYIRGKNIQSEFVRVLARDKKTDFGTGYSHGFNELIRKIVEICKIVVRGELHAIMTKNMSKQIENILKSENSNLVKFVNENNILDFIGGYDNIKNDNEFKDYVINIDGKNVNCILKKELRKGYELIRASNLIMSHNKLYIDYYHNQIDNIITKDLEFLSYKGLVLQKKNLRSTLIENKRGLDDFINANKKFLEDNLIHWAQKIYFDYILTNVTQFSLNFQNDLDIIFNQLLKEDKIKKQISLLFAKRFQDLEKNISKINIRLEKFKKPTSSKS